MKDLKSKKRASGRRKFLSMISAAAVMGFLGSSGLRDKSLTDQEGGGIKPGGTMPTIAFGPHRISRLICGSNTINGNSYLGHHTDQYMREYFTTQRIVEFLLDCEQAGITAHQVSDHRHAADYIRQLRERGSGLQFISVSSLQREKIDDVIDIAHPIGIVHHGGVTDKAFAVGNSRLVHDYVKAVKDKGLLAGVSSHNPDNIKQIADEGWEVDFFTPCFYNLTRNMAGKEELLPTLDVYPYRFFKDDPRIMTEVIRQVKQPCLAFKILAGGRLCSNQNTVRTAFQFTFGNIKPTDAVMVGMFPWYFDEVGANSQYTRDLGA